jgi:4-hydroxy-tetrahydrodipicolinate synthase
MFKGAITAIVTPIKNDKIDYSSYEKLLEFQIKNKINGILVAGCTGEPATLSYEEHKEIIKFTVDYVDKKIPVIAGTGSNNTKEAIELTEYAEKIGADAALLITPYYNKPTQKGLYLHYKEVANSVSIPIILYNVPSRTGISIEPETVAKLSEIKNIVGIKEASGSLDQVSKILTLIKREDFSILSGDDSLALPIISVGGKGVVSVASNIVPSMVSQMVEYALDGDFQNAQKLHIKLFPIFKILFIETNPIPVKTCLYLMGMINLEWRLPLCGPSEENFERIKKTIKEFGLI